MVAKLGPQAHTTGAMERNDGDSGLDAYRPAGRAVGLQGMHPVYTRMSDHTGTYDSMRRIAGRQLSAHPGLAPAANAAAIDELLDAAVLVAEALANAHRAGEVHGGIRAENIVVCGADSVVLLGWPDAAAPPSDAEADPRRDIRALGATMHLALLGRPYQADAPVGAAPGGCPVPPALLDIVLRALGADPSLRYLSADTLAADLRALRDGRRLLLPAAAGACALAAALAWLLLPHGDRGWTVVVDDRFDQATASTRHWRASLVPDYARVEPVAFARSGWRIVDGVLVGQDSQGRVANLARTDLPAGAIRARWTVTPQLSPLNLNCFVGAPNRIEGYTIHVGGWGRPDYVAVTRAPGVMVLDSRTLERPLRAGSTYACALEFDRGELSFSIDGQQVLSCRDPDPIGAAESGGMGFEVSWNTLHIDDLRIEVRPHAQADPLAAADALASAGAWSRAAAAYQGFVSARPDDPLASTARLRGAVALLRAGLAEEALPVIAGLGASPDRATALRARFERLRALAAEVPEDALDGLVSRLAEAGPDRTMARLALAACGDALDASAATAGAERILEQVGRLRRWASEMRLRPEDAPLQRWAERLNRLGRHDAVLEQVPEATAQVALALLALARYEEVHRRFPGVTWARYMAWADTGDYAEGAAALDEPFLRGRLLRESGAPAGDPRIASGFDQAFALALAQGGRVALQRYPGETTAIAFAMLGTDRAEEALAVAGAPAQARVLALLQLGRLDAAAAAVDAAAPEAIESRGCQAIAALAAGDAAGARRLAAVPAEIDWSYRARWASHAYDPCFSHHFAAFVLPGLIAWQAEGADPVPGWEELAAAQHGRCSLRVDFRWRGLLGRCDAEALLAQPYRADGHPGREAALIAALRADLARDPAAAGLWRGYLGLASPFDIAARAWARQRLARLAGEGG